RDAETGGDRRQPQRDAQTLQEQAEIACQRREIELIAHGGRPAVRSDDQKSFGSGFFSHLTAMSLRLPSCFMPARMSSIFLPSAVSPFFTAMFEGEVSRMNFSSGLIAGFLARIVAPT